MENMDQPKVDRFPVKGSGNPIPAKDNWEHRSKRMICSACMWFVRKKTAPIGRCRRRAPTMDGYPVVFDTDWCGDHKLDEITK